MEYPHEILPNPHYKQIDGNLSDYYLIRHTNTAEVSAVYNSETNIVNNEHICSPSERINDLSTSLLGIFQEGHSKIEFSKEGKEIYMSYCNPDSQVEPPVYQEHFQLNTNRHYWCIQVKHLHQKIFTIERANQSHQATCIVTHTPMLWNYWHFSLRWLLDNKQIDDFDAKEKSKFARLIGHAAKVTIAKEAIVHLPELLEIPTHIYLKN